MRAHPSRLSSLLLRAFTGVFCLLFLAITAAVLFATERHPEEYTYSLQPARMATFYAATSAGLPPRWARFWRRAASWQDGCCRWTPSMMYALSF